MGAFYDNATSVGSWRSWRICTFCDYASGVEGWWMEEINKLMLYYWYAKIPFCYPFGLRCNGAGQFPMIDSASPAISAASNEDWHLTAGKNGL